MEQNSMEMTISPTDRAILESHGVEFTGAGIIFPADTRSGQGMTSTIRSKGISATLWRFLLPAPSSLEVSFQIVEEAGREVEREVSIPLTGAFLSPEERNTSPAFQKEYQEYSHTAIHGNWSNEYSDHPAGPGVFIGSSQQW